MRCGSQRVNFEIGEFNLWYGAIMTSYCDHLKYIKEKEFQKLVHCYDEVQLLQEIQGAFKGSRRSNTNPHLPHVVLGIPCQIGGRRVGTEWTSSQSKTQYSCIPPLSMYSCIDGVWAKRNRWISSTKMHIVHRTVRMYTADRLGTVVSINFSLEDVRDWRKEIALVRTVTGENMQDQLRAAC